MSEMSKHQQNATSGPRRGFLKILLLGAGVAVASPLVSSCSPRQTDEYEVDIVLEQSTIHYAPDTIRIPRGATVTWQNKCYYSQSAICDPSKPGQGAVASLPAGTQPWSSGLLYPGQRYSRKFDAPGTYVYFSLPQISSGTIGTIIVE